MAWNDKNSINNGNQFENGVKGQFNAENLNKIIENVFYLKDAVDNAEQSGITPTGTIDITENGMFDVTNYAVANVNVQGGGGSSVNLIEGSATANGVYEPEEGSAYSKFTVSVLGGGVSIAAVNALTKGFTDRGMVDTFVEISATNGGNFTVLNVSSGNTSTTHLFTLNTGDQAVGNEQLIYADGDTLKIVDSMNGFEAEATMIYVYPDYDTGYVSYKYELEKTGAKWAMDADVSGTKLNIFNPNRVWSALYELVQNNGYGGSDVTVRVVMTNITFIFYYDYYQMGHSYVYVEGEGYNSDLAIWQEGNSTNLENSDNIPFTIPNNEVISGYMIEGGGSSFYPEGSLTVDFENWLNTYFPLS